MQKDKKREDAMKEYVELVTSLAPQWKVAHILGGHDSVKRDKPRQMMWVLKVNYRDTTRKERSRPETRKKRAPDAIRDLCRVTSIEVLQSSNAASARLWVEDGSALREGKGKATGNSASGGLGGKDIGEHENEGDPFIANFPRDLSLADCIVDKDKFKTIEDQRVHFQERMREMVRSDLNKEKNGWKFYSKSNSSAVAYREQ